MPNNLRKVLYDGSGPLRQHSQSRNDQATQPERNIGAPWFILWPLLVYDRCGGTFRDCVHLDSGDNARINRTSDRLFPCPGGRFCIWELRLTLRGRSKWITASTNDF